jgi:hypothetical protein
MHSKFTSSQEDSRGNPKPFFNITKGKVNIAIRATGAGKAKIFRQDDGGPFMTVFPFMDVEYCFSPPEDTDGLGRRR